MIVRRNNDSQPEPIYISLSIEDAAFLAREGMEHRADGFYKDLSRLLQNVLTEEEIRDDA